MNHKRYTLSILGAGIAVIAVGIAASARPASAQPPLLSHPAQVQQVFGNWNHNNDWDRDGDRSRDHDRNQARWRAEQARREAERIRHEEQARREAERARYEAERARHEAEVRHEQWLRDHHNDRNRDWDRNDSHRDWHHDNR